MTGVLLIQLGTPDAPTSSALRRYLRQFLGDPRVIEAPRLRWWLVRNLFILPFRPARSAAKYRLIWNETTGSPLLHYTRLQAEALQRQLPSASVTFAMQVGNPSVASTVRGLIGLGVDRLIVLPMYPQYSATTTASATDVLFQALMRERRVPALRVAPPYYAHPAYIDAITEVIQAELKRLPREPDHYLLSFHGIPIRYSRSGDPYATHVKRTTAALVKKLGWPRSKWTQSFQSLFGREEWLKPCPVSPPTAWKPSTKSAARRPKRSTAPAAKNSIVARASTTTPRGYRRCAVSLRKKAAVGCSAASPKRQQGRSSEAARCTACGPSLKSPESRPTSTTRQAAARASASYTCTVRD
jgi:ferrochelatase